MVFMVAQVEFVLSSYHHSALTVNSTTVMLKFSGGKLPVDGTVCIRHSPVDGVMCISHFPVDGIICIRHFILDDIICIRHSAVDGVFCKIHSTVDGNMCKIHSPVCHYLPTFFTRWHYLHKAFSRLTCNSTLYPFKMCNENSR
ncbi:hypothetical protein CHS0354_032451 [Potamilus streckersoni]|uniref:Uncharacterized protein n=1 Tax=Potamilus streckersoni TaxID=2493646 RepID=A0AAE0SPW4_9BIVA|nr:hypothetical protein CHS0354_032451 [Potamilus streckersoni]